MSRQSKAPVQGAISVTIEIRAAEGGDDAKLLVGIQAGIYEAYAKRQGLACARAAAAG